MLMMEKISKAKYEYTDIPMGENQYANIDFENTLFVDAKYTHASNGVQGATSGIKKQVV